VHLEDSIAWILFFANILWRRPFNDSLVDGLEFGRFDGGLHGGWMIGIDGLGDR